MRGDGERSEFAALVDLVLIGRKKVRESDKIFALGPAVPGLCRQRKLECGNFYLSLEMTPTSL